MMYKPLRKMFKSHHGFGRGGPVGDWWDLGASLWLCKIWRTCSDRNSWRLQKEVYLDCSRSCLL